mmetsp:Transcript_42684/g.65490  ORF Transcript_42684/g.65490 Transcript_42684/m.65490 type:complete len:126 (+) Transcript_42684:2544-2921(+)
MTEFRHNILVNYIKRIYLPMKHFRRLTFERDKMLVFERLFPDLPRIGLIKSIMKGSHHLTISRKKNTITAKSQNHNVVVDADDIGSKLFEESFYNHNPSYSMLENDYLTTIDDIIDLIESQELNH